MVSARLLPMGERAVLAEVATLDEVLALHARLRATRPAGVVDLVPAARTVLVRVDPAALPVAAARTWIAEQAGAAEAAGAESASAPLVELPIVYDGADLAETAALLGLGVGELISRHAGAAWTVAFTGFAPGFGYLVSADWPFDVPRLANPRTRVPAGAIGLAAGFTGAYPRESPGGWRLIGTTTAPLWNPSGAAPALLAPGARVRMRPQTAGEKPWAGATGEPRPLDAPPPSPGARAGLRVIEPGPLATVQDLGRDGRGHLGVARSGALDRAALRTANRLVGNAEGAAAIEVTLGGFRAVAERDLWVAISGARGEVRLAGHAVAPYEAHLWRAGEELRLDAFAHGVRAYVAVRGGLDAPAAFGSRATDRLAGLGPAPLRSGDALATADAAARPVPALDLAPWGAPRDDEIVVELAPGPRADWFSPAATRALFEELWTTSADADRVGLRLDGPVLESARRDELPSEGMVPGALQVPPGGRPVILLADGPVTGGYPVIAVVSDAALDLLAQARPGTRIRFRHAR